MTRVNEIRLDHKNNSASVIKTRMRNCKSTQPGISHGIADPGGFLKPCQGFIFIPKEIKTIGIIPPFLL